MFWSVLVPHLTASAVTIGLFVAIRRYHRSVDAFVAELGTWQERFERQSTGVRDEIRAFLEAQTDVAIAELRDTVTGRPHATGVSPGPTGWTPAKNARRCALIDRDIDGTITPAEADELNGLESQLQSHVDRVAPLPLDDVRKLHDDLVRKAAAARTPPPT